MINLFVEPIPPVYACCDTLITAADVASASRFQNVRRRGEHLAWRRIVRRELGRGVAIDYNEVGAPIVDTPNTYISVSHGANMVAVAVSDSPVGVDIESIDRNFDRVMERYISPQEQTLSDRVQWPAMVWTAKEALYKLYGRRGAQLVDEISLTSFDGDGLVAEALLGGGQRAIVEFRFEADHVVVALAQYNE